VTRNSDSELFNFRLFDRGHFLTAINGEPLAQDTIQSFKPGSEVFHLSDFYLTMKIVFLGILSARLILGNGIGYTVSAETTWH